MNESFRTHIKQINNLPTIPVIAHEILTLVDDDKLTIARLEKIIEKDPPIAAKILRVANSSFFGTRAPTETIGNAVMRIGFNNVKNIALGISIMTVLDDGEHAHKAYYQRITKHSAYVALVARFLSDKIKLNISEEILVGALLHDLGFLILSRYFFDSYLKALALLETDVSLLKAENRVFGFSHIDAGSWLAEKWNLPDAVMDTALYHHAPSRAKKYPMHAAVTHIADHITNGNIFSVTDKDPCFPFDLSSLDILGLTENDLTHLQAEICNENFTDELF